MGIQKEIYRLVFGELKKRLRFSLVHHRSVAPTRRELKAEQRSVRRKVTLMGIPGIVECLRTSSSKASAPRTMRIAQVTVR
jgi:hypothetical protein